MIGKYILYTAAIIVIVALSIFVLFLIRHTQGLLVPQWFARKFKLKVVQSGGKLFIVRLTIYVKQGSYKIHLILNDDKDEPHTHPWNFKSFLIIPYKEINYIPVKGGLVAHKIGYLPFTVNSKLCNEKHRTELYKVFGLRIPAITIGRYSEKKQLCSFCQPLGYCKNSKPKEQPTLTELTTN